VFAVVVLPATSWRVDSNSAWRTLPVAPAGLEGANPGLGGADAGFGACETEAGGSSTGSVDIPRLLPVQAPGGTWLRHGWQRGTHEQHERRRDGRNRTEQSPRSRVTRRSIRRAARLVRPATTLIEPEPTHWVACDHLPWFSSSGRSG